MHNQPPQIQYQNTDLDLVCASDLTPLADALDALGFYTLNVSHEKDGLWYARLEINDDADPHEPETTIRIMLDGIEALDGEAKDLWAACSEREFNIGYHCGDEPQALMHVLTHSTILRIANVGASLGITIYPYRP